MQPHCDHEEFEEIADNNQPVIGICFWVITEFNVAHRTVKRRFKDNKNAMMEPDAFATFSEAMDIADEYAVEIKNQFRGTFIQRIDDEIRADEFHIYIVDKMSNPVAKIGVFGEDYRKQTRH
jgi:hypothetical protein